VPLHRAFRRKREYAPGETGKLAVQFKVGTSEGTQSHVVTLVTAEPDSRTYSLTLIAEPPKTSFETASPASSVSETQLLWRKRPYEAKRLEVATGSAGDFRFTYHTDRAEMFEIAVLPSSEGGKRLLEITPTPQAVPGKADLTLTLEHPNGTQSVHVVALQIFPEPRRR
jgi:hypothetical protein